MQGFLHFVELTCFQGLDSEQAIHEQTIAACGRDASGGGMRTGHEAGFLKIGHHVADGCRRQVQPGNTRQYTRAYGLPFGNVVFDQRLEQAS